MNQVEKIINELEARLNLLDGVEIERGFLSQYQDKLAQSEKKIVIQTVQDGPAVHKTDLTTQSKLSVLVAGLLPFNPINAMDNIQGLLRNTRTAIFHSNPDDRAGKFNSLCTNKPIEPEPVKFYPPSDSQQNTTFIMLVEFTYSTKN